MQRLQIFGTSNIRPHDTANINRFYGNEARSEEMFTGTTIRLCSNFKSVSAHMIFTCDIIEPSL